MYLSYLVGYNDVVQNDQNNHWSELAAEMFGQKSDMRVRAWTNPPYIYGNSVYWDQDNNEYIQVYGPLYSLIKEVVNKLNIT